MLLFGLVFIIFRKNINHKVHKECTEFTSSVPLAFAGTNNLLDDFKMGNLPIDISFFDLNGAVLLIVYEDRSPGAPCSTPGKNGKIVLWHGLDDNYPDPSVPYNYLMGTGATGGPLGAYSSSVNANGFIVIADVEDNGSKCGINSTNPGTTIPGDMYNLVQQATTFSSAQQQVSYSVLTSATDCYALSVMGAYMQDNNSVCFPDFHVAITGNTVICTGSGTNSTLLTATVTGGTTPYSYKWSDGSTNSTTTVTPAQTTTFFVTVVDFTGCSVVAATTVAVLDPPTVNITGDAELCFGELTTLAAAVSGGTAPYTFQWSTGNTSSVVTINSQTMGVGSSELKVTVTDAAGCNAFATKTIVINPVPDMPQIGFSQFPLKCPGSDINYFVTNPQSGVTYTWKASAQGTIVGANPGTTVTAFWPVSLNGSAGILTVTASLANGCTSSATVQVVACCNSSLALNNNVTILNNKNASSFGSTTGLSGVNVEINGIFTVDKNFSFNNCVINMGENAKIVIPSSVSNTVLDIFCTSIFAQNCQFPIIWDGIYVNPPADPASPNNKVLFNATATGDCGNLTPPIVADAKNAVVSVNGGHFALKNYDYRDNYTGLDVRNFNGNHTGTVNGCIFRHLNGLITPLSNRKASFGIKIKEVENIGIGSVADGGSEFIALDSVGIHCEISNATILKNKFDLITTPFFSGPFGQPIPERACIRVIGFNKVNPFPVSNVVIGSSQGANTFKNSTMGVLIKFDGNFTIENNSFDNMNGAFATGIHAIGSNLGLIKISSNNKFKNFKTGIRLTQIGANVQVFNNQFTIISPQESTGILLENVIIFSKFSTTIIKNNLLTDVFIGIKAINYKHVNAVDISNNVIVYNGAVATRTGVQIINSRAHCNQNTVKFNGATPTNATFQLTGFLLLNSPSSRITNSNIQKMVNGIRCISNSKFATVACNKMTRCLRGIFLNSSTLGDQGTDKNPQDNQWFNTPSSGFDILGQNNTQENWWHRTSTPPGTALLHFDPAPFSPPGAIIQNKLFDYSFNFTCTVGCLFTPCFQKQFSEAVKSPKQTPVLVEENKFLEKEHILAELRNAPALMALGTSDDAVLQAFHDSMMQTNSGKIREVQELAASENIALAKQKNALISPNNIMEENYKTVHNVFLKSWAERRYTLDATETTTLEAVAEQNAFTGGSAVYHARAMLGITIEDELPAGSNMLVNSNNKAKQVAESKLMNQVYLTSDIFLSKIYPNPNNGSMMLNYALANGQTGEIEILDVYGKLILRQKLPSGNRLLQLSDDKLLSGIYHYRIAVDGVVRITDKLVVIK